MPSASTRIEPRSESASCTVPPAGRALGVRGVSVGASASRPHRVVVVAARREQRRSATPTASARIEPIRIVPSPFRDARCVAGMTRDTDRIRSGSIGRDRTGPAPVPSVPWTTDGIGAIRTSTSGASEPRTRPTRGRCSASPCARCTIAVSPRKPCRKRSSAPGASAIGSTRSSARCGRGSSRSCGTW